MRKGTGPATVLEAAAEGPLDLLDLQSDVRSELDKIVQAYDRFRDLGIGLNLVIDAPEIDVGRDVAIALVHACGLQMNRLALAEALFSEKPSVWDIEGGGTRTARESVLSTDNAANRLTAFIDYRLQFSEMLADHARAPIPELATFLSRLERSCGLVCVVTRGIRSEESLPLPFHRLFRIGYPSEGSQAQRWMSHLDAGERDGQKLRNFVERHPMHLSHIDATARRASSCHILGGGDGRLSLGFLEKTLQAEQLRGTARSTQPLFRCQE